MFGLFKKDPLKKLEEQYRKKSEEAINAQRNGDIETFSQLSFEADKLLKELEKLESEKKS